MVMENMMFSVMLTLVKARRRICHKVTSDNCLKYFFFVGQVGAFLATNASFLRVILKVSN